MLLRTVRRLEARHLVRDRHFNPELRRLVGGARHQGVAADASRKAEIILDPRGGARLAASGPAVEHENRKAFRSGVNRRRKARRARPDNGNVINHDPDRSDQPSRDTAPARRRWDCAAIVPVGTKRSATVLGST